MGFATGIKWCHHTHNRWWGCHKASQGCAMCYAEELSDGRFGNHLWGPPATTSRKFFDEHHNNEIFRWDRKAGKDGERRRVFVMSMADWAEDHPALGAPRAKLLADLATLKHLDVLLLTKRTDLVRDMVPAAWLEPGGWPAHIWCGTSIEDQWAADTRLPHLLRIPAPILWVSMEPLLGAVLPTRYRPMGPVEKQPKGFAPGLANRPSPTQWANVPALGEPTLNAYVPTCTACGALGPDALSGPPSMPDWEHRQVWPGPNGVRLVHIPCGAIGARVQWTVIGGESGPKARWASASWYHANIAVADAYGVPVFMKQMGTRIAKAEGLKHHKGEDSEEWPDALRVQQFPRSVAWTPPPSPTPDASSYRMLP